ncbi:DMT family transporter [Tropicibacter sp. R16_0]|uniref:DMT family transporter n=1 Tax=Tropicibacter sp. R16_0 TaxID=2821102 RepID=UPI001ADD2F84|nr:DMT family transporter [Tropicibacter sp. R16_0]MBO9453174.1 DMT family transporter [Tropicibacter sp. R16_0]
MKASLLGAALVALYTILISSADAITKLIAGGYAAPQLFCLSGLIVVALSLLVDRMPSQRQGLRTRSPWAMTVRSGATVMAAVCFFNAFGALPLADVFLYIGLMPLLSGLMSGLILREQVRPSAWFALTAGFIGVLSLFPGGLQAITTGHLFGLGAAVFGTLSIVMSRFIGRHESNVLAQVFYPNLALFVAMGAALPFVWVPMPLSDLVWVVVYAAVLFSARWVLVLSLRTLAVYVVTPLMNLQFVWMVILGAVFFGELPTTATLLGVAIVMASGLYLVWEQFAPEQTEDTFARNFKTDP